MAMSVRQLCVAVYLLCAASLIGAEVVGQKHGAFSPSAPVSMTYELPDVLPESGPVELTVTLSTPVQSGRIVVEVLEETGLAVAHGANADFHVDAGQQVFDHHFAIELGADDQRSLLVSVTVDSVIGPQSRTYRIDFSRSTATTLSSPQPVLKFLPATPAR